MKVSLPLVGTVAPHAAGVRVAALCAVPIAVGAMAPWLMWRAGGRLSAGDLAAATLATVAVYLRSLSALRAKQLSISRHLRGLPPLGDRTVLSLAVCGGLAASLTVPGVSALALIDAVGLPRVAGIVQTYDIRSLAGATLGLTGKFGKVWLAPDGSARLSVGRGGRVRLLQWRFVQSGVCIGSHLCLMLDPSDGRLWVGTQQVGRVTTIDRATP